MTLDFNYTKYDLVFNYKERLTLGRLEALKLIQTIGSPTAPKFVFVKGSMINTNTINSISPSKDLNTYELKGKELVRIDGQHSMPLAGSDYENNFKLSISKLDERLEIWNTL